MTLFKRESTANIFLGIFRFFFGQAISQNSSKPVIVKGFYLFIEPNNYCFCRAAHRYLSQCNLRNTVTVLRTVVKSQEGLKGTRFFP